MRDGIYKNLTLGSAWKSLLRSCEREAERDGTALSRAGRAVIADLRSQLSANLVQRLLAMADQGESLLPGFSRFDKDLSPRELGGTNSPFENELLSSVRSMERAGVKGKAIIHKALNESIEDLKRRRFRHIEQHCLTESEFAATPIIRAAKKALAFDHSALIDQLVRGERPKMPRARRPIDPDEDLIGAN